jgi:hypothetical protein
MWIIRFLNGPLAGQVVPLTKNSMLLGRAPTCDIKVPSGSVSKEHTRIEIFDDKLIISDAGSRNGTFINGVQVRSTKARSGDKVAIHDILFEVQRVPESWAHRFRQPYPVYGQPPINGNLAYQHRMPPQGGGGNGPDGGYGHEQAEDGQAAHGARDPLSAKLPRLYDYFFDYVDRVVMPAIYRLPEMFEFRWVLAGFMLAFILLVTTLSTIPLSRILKSSIEEESQRHALTIATTLARINRPFLVSGQETASTVEIATTRPGVLKAYILSNVDGNIVAPASNAGSYPDLPFVHEARKNTKEAVKQIDDNTVIAMVPVMVFNQDTGSQSVTHWAVVTYDMTTLAVNNAQVLSLFITTLTIALALGFVLFFFLYKLIEHPIRGMNQQLDVALKEGQETVSVTYQFPSLQLLASNISSALTRALNGGEQSPSKGVVEHDRNREIANLVELIGFAAMGIRAADLSIAAVNQAFEQRVGIPGEQLASMGVNELNDQALKLSVKDLIERVDANPDDMASNELEFSGLGFQIVAQAVFGTSKVAYYLIVLLPTAEAE